MTEHAKYAVRNLVLGGGLGAPISAELFQDVSQAHQGLIDLIRLEDIYDVTMLNYAELEKVVLRNTVDDMLSQIGSHIEWERSRREIDRSVCNLLSSGRLVRDSAIRTSTQFFGRGSNEAKAVHDLLATQSQKHLGFRTMEALRNYTQHNGLPTESLSFKHSWIDHEDEKRARLQVSFIFSLTPKIFLSGRDRDPELVELLETKADKHGRVAMLPLIRAYMDGLSHVQDGLRDLFSEKEASWEKALDEVRQIYASTGGDPQSPGLSAVRQDKSGNVEEDIALNIEISERLAHLRKRNRKLINMAKRQIVS